MRLLVTGKSRSGKSTAVHRILAHALRMPWSRVLLLDGKGSELHYYASLDGVTYLGPDELDGWADELQDIATQLSTRYANMTARGLRKAAADDPRVLILADEIQKGTRDRGAGRRIKDALMLIAEQSAALGDVMILTAQREQHSVPPNVRINMSALLRMLGKGYFHLTADGYQTKSGRTAHVEDPGSILATVSDGLPDGDLDPGNLPHILGSQAVEPGRAPVTLYLGKPGSGKTYCLRNHPNGRTARHVYADLAYPHRQILTSIIEQAGAVVPPRASIPDLTDVAGLAVQAEPTLLLLDNLGQASDRTCSTVRRLIDASEEVALAAKKPRSPAERRRLEPFIPRCDVREIQPLTTDQAHALLDQHLPDDLAERAATERRILELAAGHPATLVNLSRRARRGTLRELRDFSAPQTQQRVNVSVLVLLALLLMLVFIRADGYTIGAAATVMLMLLRPFFFRSMRGNR